MDFITNALGDMAVAASLEASVRDAAEPGEQKRVDAYAALPRPIDRERIQAAWQTLLRYKAGKANLERRVVQNQQWYRLRQWDTMRTGGAVGESASGRRENAAYGVQVEPTSPWLFNAIANKHADAMDNTPRLSILPREESDRREAKLLSSIVPVVLDQNDFEQLYADHVDNKLIAGTGVYGVFWDPQRLNGLGDIAIEECDILSLFWEAGVTDIQRSRNLFYVSLQDNDLLESAYPQLAGKLGGQVMDVARYVYDDAVDTSGKSVLVDWYYKKRSGGRTMLHYCKFVAGQPEPIFATENEPETYPNGWYDHGLYPFVFDPMFKCKGTPCGFSYIDVGKKTQEYIDRADQAMLQNLLFNARPRHFIRSDGAVNEEEYADVSRDFVHVDGNLGMDSVMPIPTNPLPEIYLAILRDKVQELKETTGNRDVNTGGAPAGVTAASAIAAIQEAGGKLSRDHNRASYRAFRKLGLLIIELIRQFYDTARCFRITGESGESEFVEYSNMGLRPQPQGEMVDGVPRLYGVDVGYRVPLFDLEVSPERSSPYSRMSQNELALQFYNAGFFNPQRADQALSCLKMMDFPHKEELMNAIRQQAEEYSVSLESTASSAALGMRGRRIEFPKRSREERARQMAGESATPR